MDLDEALTRLATFDDRKSCVVEMRYSGGMTAEETSDEGAEFRVQVIAENGK